MNGDTKGTIYIAALEMEENNPFYLHAVRVIKLLAAANEIQTVSMEVEVDLWQPAFDAYDHTATRVELDGKFSIKEVDGEIRIGLPGFTPFHYATLLIDTVKKIGLRLIASDCRGGLSGYVVRTLTDELDANKDLTDKEANSMLQPVFFDGSMEGSIYQDYLLHPERITDISDFFLFVHDEERVAFITDRIDGHLRAFPGGLLHLGAPDLAEDLEQRLKARGHHVEIIDLMAYCDPTNDT